MGGKPHADVGDERWSFWRPAFDDINNIATVQNREVGILSDGISQSGDEVSPNQCKGLLAQVTGPKIMRCDSESPTTISVDDVPVFEHGGKKVVGR
jgi:hypothetical protein